MPTSIAGALRHFHALAVLACLLVCLPIMAEAQEPDRIRILVATKDMQRPLQVAFLTKGALARGMLLPFGNLGNAIAFEARNKDYNAAIGTFDRRPTLVSAIEKALETKYPMFDVVDQGATYDDDRASKAVIAKAKSEGIWFVLLIDDQFAGISSAGMASDGHDVSVMSAIRYELYETAKGERLSKDKLIAGGLNRVSLEKALTDRAFLEQQMPVVHAQLATLVVGGMVRTDSLHRMATAAGQGDRVPALGAILKRYEKAVTIEMIAPDKWRTIKFNTRFVMSTEPKSELRFKMGVRTDVDLLISELGQDVDTMEEYQRVAMTRLTDAGFDASTLQVRTEFQKEGYDAFSILNSTSGAGQYLLFRKIDDLHVVVITVIATERFEEILAANKTDIQAAIDGVKVRIQAGR